MGRVVVTGRTGEAARKTSFWVSAYSGSKHEDLLMCIQLDVRARKGSGFHCNFIQICLPPRMRLQDYDSKPFSLKSKVFRVG